MQTIKTYQPKEKNYGTIGIVMIKSIKTLNPSFSLPSRHHHKGQPLFTISSHLRRRVCCRRHTGNVPNTSLALHGKLLLALPAACAGCCTRACASCCTHSVRCWLLACSACLLAASAAGRALLVASLKISGLRRSDLENPRLIYKFPRPILAYKIL